jgi:hypothetical protein
MSFYILKGEKWFHKANGSKMHMPEYTVNLPWDAEAAVWTATSDSIPGLVMESGSLDALIERVRFAAPELLEMNGIPAKNFSLFFHSERHEQVCL